jgi:hypothetical protein
MTALAFTRVIYDPNEEGEDGEPDESLLQSPRII